MIELTDVAKEQLDLYFNGKEKAPIRIFINAGGCGGPSLAMALDEPKENDDVFDVNSYKFVADKEFMKEARTVKIDFAGMGFAIDSEIDFGESGCSGCGSHGSCCS